MLTLHTMAIGHIPNLVFYLASGQTERQGSFASCFNSMTHVVLLPLRFDLGG